MGWVDRRIEPDDCRCASLVSVIAVASIVLLSPAAASAQGSPPKPSTQQTFVARSEATKLGKQGEKSFKAGEFANAYDFFRLADEYFHAPPFIVWQARAKAKMNALVEARNLYKRVLDEDLAPNASAQFRTAHSEAKQELEELEKQIPSVRILLTNAPAGARVTIDGVKIEPDRLAAPIAQNPGTHTIIAFANTGTFVEETAEMKEGAHTTVELEFPRPPAEPPPKPQQESPPSPALESRLDASPSVRSPPVAPKLDAKDGMYRVPMAVAIAAGCAGFSVGLIAGAVWRYKEGEIHAQCDGDRCPDRLAPEIDSSKLTGRIALSGLVLGAAGFSTNAILSIIEGAKPRSSGGNLSLSLGPNSATIRGKF